MTTPWLAARPAERALRAADADRERAADLLRVHTGAGRITADELDERLDVVYASRTLGELDAVFVDLPREEGGRPHGRPQPRARRAGGHRGPPAHGIAAVLLVVFALTVAAGHPAVWLALPLLFVAARRAAGRRFGARRHGAAGW